MEWQYNMEITEERAEKIRHVLKILYEDQYGCKLIRVKGKEECQKTERYDN